MYWCLDPGCIRVNKLLYAERLDVQVRVYYRIVSDAGFGDS